MALENAKAKLAEARAAATNDPTGEKQEKAWCELADLGDPNPYRKEAQKGCAEVRSYTEQRKLLVAAMQRDWTEKVEPFLALQHRSAADKEKVAKAFLDAYGVLADRDEVLLASDFLKMGGYSKSELLALAKHRIEDKNYASA